MVIKLLFIFIESRLIDDDADSTSDDDNDDDELYLRMSLSTKSDSTKMEERRRLVSSNETNSITLDT